MKNYWNITASNFTTFLLKQLLESLSTPSYPVASGTSEDYPGKSVKTSSNYWWYILFFYIFFIFLYSLFNSCILANFFTLGFDKKHQIHPVNWCAVRELQGRAASSFVCTAVLHKAKKLPSKRGDISCPWFLLRTHQEGKQSAQEEWLVLLTTHLHPLPCWNTFNLSQLLPQNFDQGLSFHPLLSAALANHQWPPFHCCLAQSVAVLSTNGTISRCCSSSYGRGTTTPVSELSDQISL